MTVWTTATHIFPWDPPSPSGCPDSLAMFLTRHPSEDCPWVHWPAEAISMFAVQAFHSETRTPFSCLSILEKPWLSLLYLLYKARHNLGDNFKLCI